jgi:hypothetical protein
MAEGLDGLIIEEYNKRILPAIINLDKIGNIPLGVYISEGDQEIPGLQ